MSRCVILSSAGVGSINVRSGSRVVLEEVARIPVQHLRSGEKVAPNVSLA